MRVEMCPVVNYEEIEAEFDRPIEAYRFYSVADQVDGYFWLDTSEDAIADIDWDIEQEQEFCKKYNCKVDPEYLAEQANQKELINFFRGAGYTDGILIYVWN